MLLDLREPEKFSILSLDSNEKQRVHCYEIQTKQQSNEIEITIHGTLEIVDHIIQKLILNQWRNTLWVAPHLFTSSQK